MIVQSATINDIPSLLPDEAGALARLAATIAQRDLPDRLVALRQAIDGRLVFTTSFGLEDQAIGHAIFTHDLPIDVVTLDTGRLFPQVYDVWAETERRYGVTIRAFYPDRATLETLVAKQGIDGFRQSIRARQACCGVRKVEPLRRALAGASAWVTGLRADQSDARAETLFVTRDAVHRLFKLSPLADWSRARVTDYVARENIPHNVLHTQGFPSIGCAPCTRAVAPGEPERAGRWWWEQDDEKECGLHAQPLGAPALAEAGADA
jgi:phosphoadenosine phosphosulfate reductase